MNLEDIFHSYSDADFTNHALALFRYQHEENEVYRLFCDMLKINPQKITTLTQIPFLPISFFKTYQVKTGNFVAEMEFWSSGTIQNITSKTFPFTNALSCTLSNISTEIRTITAF
jgi:hypothetical protein